MAPGGGVLLIVLDLYLRGDGVLSCLDGAAEELALTGGLAP